MLLLCWFLSFFLASLKNSPLAVRRKRAAATFPSITKASIMFARAYLAHRASTSPCGGDHRDLERGDADVTRPTENSSIACVAMARARTVLVLLPWLFGLALCVVLDGVAAVAAILGAAAALAALALWVVSVVVAAPAWGPAAWRWRRAWIDSAPPA